MKRSKSQIYRWPFAIRDFVDVPDNFREIVKTTIGERIDPAASAVFIPPVEDAWVTGRTTDSFVLVLFRTPEVRMVIFQEDRKGNLIASVVTPESLRMFAQSTGLLFGKIDLRVTHPESFISIPYKHIAETYIRPLIRELLCGWLRVDHFEGSKDISHIPEQVPYHFRTAAADFLPDSLPVLQQMFHSESKVSTGFFRTERIPPSLWILTPLFLLLVQGYHASASDWGHVVTIICSRHLQQLLVTTDLKKRMNETQIWIGDISSPISLKTGIACLHDLTSMQEAIKQFSTKHQAVQGS